MDDIDDLLAYRDALKAKNSQNSGIRRVTQWEGLAAPTIRLYCDLQEQWEKFKNEKIREPDAIAHLENIQIFFYWYAKKSKGKLGERSTITTLLYQVGRFGCMYNRRYKEIVLESILDEVRDYVKTDLRDQLDLQDAKYEKEFANWKDIEIIIHYLLVEDTHQYHDNRFRAQILWIFLIIADDGERIGAITRSEAYRHEEIALCYEDVKLYLKPAVNPDAKPQFKLEITFNNRKGERRDPQKFLEQTYFQRSDHPHCAVLIFLVLAFLDDAFEEFATPSDLFAQRNLRSSDYPIRIKQKMFPIPILRRMEQKGSRKLSPTLPWSASSATADSQRLFSAAGFPQRFTFYNPRRGVSNAIVDSNVPDARRKQLMGHSGPSDKVFRKFYQSRKFTVDTGNLFRKEEQRQEKSEVLCMHLKRDPDAPNDLPTALQDQIRDADDTIQELLQFRSEVIEELAQLGSDAESDYDRVTLKLARERIRRALGRRWAYIRKHRLTEFRDSHFINGPKLSPALPRRVEATRSDLAEAFYPMDGLEGCALKALEAFIAYCTNERTQDKPTDDEPTDDEPADDEPADDEPDYGRGSGSGGEFELLAASRPRPHSKKMDMTPDDTQLIVYLREKKSLPWKHVKAHFPGRSTESIRNHYNLRCTSVEKSTRRIWTSDEDRLLLDLKENVSRFWKRGGLWERIATNFSGATPDSSKHHYSFLKKSGVPLSQPAIQEFQGISQPETTDSTSPVQKRCRSPAPSDDQPLAKWQRGKEDYQSRLGRILASEGRREKLVDKDYKWIRYQRDKGKLEPREFL